MSSLSMMILNRSLTRWPTVAELARGSDLIFLESFPRAAFRGGVDAPHISIEDTIKIRLLKTAIADVDAGVL